MLIIDKDTLEQNISEIFVNSFRKVIQENNYDYYKIYVNHNANIRELSHEWCARLKCYQSMAIHNEIRVSHANDFYLIASNKFFSTKLDQNDVNVISNKIEADIKRMVLDSGCNVFEVDKI